MKTCIIFHSYTGITRGIAERVKAACGGELLEVQPRQAYSKLTAYTTGCLRARRGEADPIDPEIIDAGFSDVIVLGTPVWAFKPTPAINGAISALQNCDGKKAVIFATCGGQAGDTTTVIKKALEAKGVKVVAEFTFNKNDVTDEKKIAELVAAVKAAGPQ
jgi:Putative NADPH-quinone reductase (modulator of drug activity B)